MDYIVMDLEWNQNPYGKNHHSDLTFEIIEIGAVRVTKNREILESYQQVIHPKIFKKLHYKIQEITHFTNEELNHGKDFKTAVTEFLEWCGDDFMFCTWGSMDLTELQKNMKHYGLERILEFPLFYVDLQKMFSLRYDDGHMKRTLMSAVEYLNIQENKGFHRALSDAYYTAKVMQTMDFEKYKGRLSIDTFYPPRIKEEEIFVRFDQYTKLVTREFLSRDEMFEEDYVKELRCNTCDKPLEILIDWFSDSGKTYYCLGQCSEHGYVRGKIRIRKLEVDSFYAIKIMKATDEEGANSIIEKQETIREKRRERRQRSLDREIIVDEIWENNEDSEDADDDDD